MRLRFRPRTAAGSNAWGGATATNDFIAWAGDQVSERYGVTVEHVKLTDTADAVSRVLAEKTAGKDSGGAVDLIWINGANFAAMKEAGLLFGPWAEVLPNFRYVDVAGKPAVISDFTVPTEGLVNADYLKQRARLIQHDAPMRQAPVGQPPGAGNDEDNPQQPRRDHPK